MHPSGPDMCPALHAYFYSGRLLGHAPLPRKQYITSTVCSVECATAHLNNFTSVVVAGLVASDRVASALLLQLVVPTAPQVDDLASQQGSTRRAPRVRGDACMGCQKMTMQTTSMHASLFCIHRYGPGGVRWSCLCSEASASQVDNSTSQKCSTS